MVENLEHFELTLSRLSIIIYLVLQNKHNDPSSILVI